MKKGKMAWEASKAADATKPCLLSLPAEVLYMIYELVFESPRIVKNIRPRYDAIKTNREDIKMIWADRVVPPHGEVVRTALMRTCRQIYHESSKVFYGENIFILDHSHSVKVKVGETVISRQLICPEYTRFIRQVAVPVERVEWWAGIIECSKNALNWPALQNLNILLSAQAYFTLKQLSGSRGHQGAVGFVVESIRNICSMQNIRIPKSLNIRIVVAPDLMANLGGEGSLQELQAILDEAVGQVRKLRRL